jgi:flagellar biosynthesis protein FlhF
MQIKKFEAPTIQEALDSIKRELGPEAIILQTKRNRKGFGLLNGSSVEVTAAISDRSIQKKSYVDKKLLDANRSPLHSMTASQQADVLDHAFDRNQDRRSKNARQAGSAPEQRRYIDIDPTEIPSASYSSPKLKAGPSTVEEEVKYLKRMIEELKMAQAESHSNQASAQITTQILGTPALMDAFENLILAGMDRRYALGLVKKTAFELGPDESNDPELVLDQVTFELMSATEVMSPLGNLTAGSRGIDGPLCIALVGPTGVGKTTTLAKIASQAILNRSLRVGLVNLDAYKVAAIDQLATYAKILNVPFRSASTPNELKSALEDFKSLDLVLIDTTGRSQRDIESLKEMNQLLQTLEISVQTHLVVSVTTRDTELYDTANRFSVFKPQALIVSKLDEASCFGAIHNMSQRAKLPLSYFTTGQRVPEDLEESTRDRVAALIMDL